MSEIEELLGVAAILHTGDGRFLMQLRDDAASVSMRAHWGLFGGRVERGEAPAAAMRRELAEELAFRPARITAPFFEISYALGFAGLGAHRKYFFGIPIRARDTARMRLAEGERMALFRLDQILAMQNVIPWDAFGLTVFARRAPLRRALRRKPPLAGGSPRR
jgi:8-oxo-dGTP pyrophosphatase MutT (NUDIX family)